MLAVAEPKSQRRTMLPTGQQKLVMSLRKAGYSYADIGVKLDITRQSARELDLRGKAAAAAFRREMAEFLEGETLA